MPVPKANATFCRAHVAWDCHLVLLPDEQDEDEDPRLDGTYDRRTNTVVCTPCYAAMKSITPSGNALSHELDSAAALMRRQGLVVSDTSITKHVEWLSKTWPGFADALNMDLPIEDERDDFVYFFQSGNDEEQPELKIGHSLDPLNRQAALQTGTSEEFELLHVTTGGEQAEQEWHERFAHLRIDGGGEEWFTAGQDLLDAIEQDRQANPDRTRDLVRIAEERLERERALRILRSEGHQAPYHPVLVRLATATSSWRAATGRSRYFLLPSEDFHHAGYPVFGEILSLANDPEGRHLRFLYNKTPSMIYTDVEPEGETYNIPLEHLIRIRQADFDLARDQQFEWTIPDMIAHHVREGLGRTLVHHKLLEWWRELFEHKAER